MPDKIFKPENMSRLDSEQRRQVLPPALVLDAMDIRRGDSILDIGAGTGYFAIPASDLAGPTGKVFAADISEKMLEETRKRAGSRNNMEFLLCTPNSIPLEDNSADRALLAFVYHEIENRVSYIKKIKKHIKNRGILAIAEWDICESPMGPPMNERISMEALRKEAESAGFTYMSGKRINDFQYITVLRVEKD
jgi:ubiquinone/menaquinone biosynthesis C-methylase UbiE